MSDNQKLPKCDCINDCGDDDNVAKGLRQRCSRYDEIQAENLDNQALRLLTNAMRSKLAASRRKGRSGWNDKTQCSAEYLSQLLREHVEKGDPVDVANFCAFLSARGEGIAPQAAPATVAAPTAQDSCCAWSVWWTHNKSKYTTMRQSSIAAWDAGIAYALQRTAPQAQADARDAVTQAVRDYYFALDNRQHGGVAAERALESIQAALGLHWVQGAEASTRSATSTQGAQQ